MDLDIQRSEHQCKAFVPFGFCKKTISLFEENVYHQSFQYKLCGDSANDKFLDECPGCIYSELVFCIQKAGFINVSRLGGSLQSSPHLK